MGFMHITGRHEYYWLIIPAVGLFVALFNAYRMGKLRNLPTGWKITGAALLILAVVAAGCLLNERVLDSDLIPADGLSAYPELERAFLELEDGFTGENIVVVEVGNLFSSRAVYLLPCYSASTKNVPQNGQTHWYTEVWILGDDEERVTIRDLNLELDFEEETMLSSRVELNGDEGLYDMGTDREVLLENEIPLPDGERFRIGVLASTSAFAQAENMETHGSFVWNYDLYYDGTKVAEIRNDTLSCAYLINAT